MKPAGRSTSSSFAGSTGHSGPNGGLGLVTVVSSIAVETANGCPAAWVKTAPPRFAVTRPSNASTPKPGGVPAIVVGSTVLADAAPPPEIWNELVADPAAFEA